MKTHTQLMIVTGVLVLSSAHAAASEYAKCLKAQQPGGGSGLGTMRVARYVSGSYATSYGASYSSSTYYMPQPSVSSLGFASWGNAPRVSAMARACRHLKKVTQPAYRIIGIKSPSLRYAVNKSGKDQRR